MPINSSRRQRFRLSSVVIDDLIASIVQGKYPVGASLPIEGELCEIHSVSRTVVREAIAAISEKGLVSTIQGRGPMVLDKSNWDLLDPQILKALFKGADGLQYVDNLIEIRATLEASMAAKAAAKITDDGKLQLLEQFQNMEKAVSSPMDYAEHDVHFHQIIMRISGDLLSQVIIAKMQEVALETFFYNGSYGEDHLQLTHEAHRRILKAILSRSPAAASLAMRSHIEDSWDRRRPSQ